jgi:hypothetical protein
MADSDVDQMPGFRNNASLARFVYLNIMCRMPDLVVEEEAKKMLEELAKICKETGLKSRLLTAHKVIDGTVFIPTGRAQKRSDLIGAYPEEE